MLWNRAKEALSGADAIVFVGYRFPESDGYAREHLFQAIGANDCRPDEKTKRSILSLHTVLGNSEDSARHSKRLASMLRFACAPRHEATLARQAREVRGGQGGFYYVFEHSLFAQDFFSLAGRDALFGPD